MFIEAGGEDEGVEFEKALKEGAKEKATEEMSNCVKDGLEADDAVTRLGKLAFKNERRKCDADAKLRFQAAGGNPDRYEAVKRNGAAAAAAEAVSACVQDKLDEREGWELLGEVEATVAAGTAFWEAACGIGGGGYTGGNVELTVDDMFMLEMGDVVDYYKPTQAMSLCNYLQNNKKHTWSATEDGVFVVPGYDNGAGKYGGSDYQWPKALDGRDYLGYWGSETGNKGCCCHSSSDITGEVDAVGWGQECALYIKLATNRGETTRGIREEKVKECVEVGKETLEEGGVDRDEFERAQAEQAKQGAVQELQRCIAEELEEIGEPTTIDQKNAFEACGASAEEEFITVGGEKERFAKQKTKAARESIAKGVEACVAAEEPEDKGAREEAVSGCLDDARQMATTLGISDFDSALQEGARKVAADVMEACVKVKTEDELETQAGAVAACKEVAQEAHEEAGGNDEVFDDEIKAGAGEAATSAFQSCRKQEGKSVADCAVLAQATQGQAGGASADIATNRVAELAEMGSADFFSCMHLAAGKGYAAVNCKEPLGHGEIVRLHPALCEGCDGYAGSRFSGEQVNRGLVPALPKQAQWTTKEGFVIEITGFSHARDYAGPGFMCNGHEKCYDLMKITVKNLQPGQLYDWTLWGYQRDEHPDPGKYELWVNNKAAGSGQFMHCPTQTPEACEPQQEGVTKADAAGMLTFRLNQGTYESVLNEQLHETNANIPGYAPKDDPKCEEEECCRNMCNEVQNCHGYSWRFRSADPLSPHEHEKKCFLVSEHRKDGAEMNHFASAWKGRQALVQKDGLGYITASAIRIQQIYTEVPVRRDSAEHFFRSNALHLHSYGPDPYSRCVLCDSLTGEGLRHRRAHGAADALRRRGRDQSGDRRHRVRRAQGVHAERRRQDQDGEEQDGRRERVLRLHRRGVVHDPGPRRLDARRRLHLGDLVQRGRGRAAGV